MNETITICENVCRDFSWSIPFLKWIGSILPSVITASTVVYVALVAYPKQKDIDRRNEIRKEQRGAYREFFSAWQQVRVAFEKAEFQPVVDKHNLFAELFEAKGAFFHAISVLRLYADVAVINAAAKCDSVLQDIVKGLRDEIEPFASKGEPVMAEELVNKAKEVIYNKSREFSNAENELANAIRTAAFSMDEEIHLNRLRDLEDEGTEKVKS